MLKIALKMLLADKPKFFGFVFTITFAAFLITQQVCVFVSIMKRTASQVYDIRDAAIWVADPKTRYVDEVWPLQDGEVYRVRQATGVAWAVPLFKTLAIIKSPQGIFRSCLILGIDDATFVGGPRKMLFGQLEGLNQPDAVILDKDGYEFFFPNQPFEVGQTFELNDRRAFLVGICETEPPFQTVPVVYAKYSHALDFTGPQRRKLSFILANPLPGYTVQETCASIQETTGLAAFSRDEFAWKTIDYYLKHTGILINFGLTITIAVLVGMVVSGQTFYLFTLENLKYFATLKAMGVRHAQIIKMILLQAVFGGVLGYCMGMGLAAFFFRRMAHYPATRTLVLRWEPMLAAGLIIVLIVSAVSILSLRRVLKLEPATVFRN
jgi:putative ABC transport system permease protein